jgi:hypothetical protein
LYSKGLQCQAMHGQRVEATVARTVVANATARWNGLCRSDEGSESEEAASVGSVRPT